MVSSKVLRFAVIAVESCVRISSTAETHFCDVLTVIMTPRRRILYVETVQMTGPCQAWNGESVPFSDSSLGFARYCRVSQTPRRFDDWCKYENAVLQIIGSGGAVAALTFLRGGLLRLETVHADLP